METTKSARLLRIAREALAKRAGAEEQEGAEAGFTLIELMVVLLIMAILLAIAIPTFLGVKGGAQDRSAQSNLSNSLISAKAIYATNGSYDAGNAGANMVGSLNSSEPALAFGVGNPGTTGGNSVSVDVVDANVLLLVDSSAANNGTCWAVIDNVGDAATAALPAAGTWYSAWKPSAANGCTANKYPTAIVPGNWTQSYPAAKVGSLTEQ